MVALQLACPRPIPFTHTVLSSHFQIPLEELLDDLEALQLAGGAGDGEDEEEDMEDDDMEEA